MEAPGISTPWGWVFLYETLPPDIRQEKQTFEEQDETLRSSKLWRNQFYLASNKSVSRIKNVNLCLMKLFCKEPLSMEHGDCLRGWGDLCLWVLGIFVMPIYVAMRFVDKLYWGD